jgi:hypothetical protein
VTRIIIPATNTKNQKTKTKTKQKIQKYNTAQFTKAGTLFSQK